MYDVYIKLKYSPQLGNVLSISEDKCNKFGGLNFQGPHLASNKTREHLTVPNEVGDNCFIATLQIIKLKCVGDTVHTNCPQAVGFSTFTSMKV